MNLKVKEKNHLVQVMSMLMNHGVRECLWKREGIGDEAVESLYIQSIPCQLHVNL
jgi:hypothetical protein